jgi:hypothetical protein
MKPIAIFGAILLIFGIVALAYQGLTYTRRERVIDIGPLKVDADRERTIPLPPVVGGAAVAAGVVLLIAGTRKK